MQTQLTILRHTVAVQASLFLILSALSYANAQPSTSPAPTRINVAVVNFHNNTQYSGLDTIVQNAVSSSVSGYQTFQLVARNDLPPLIANLQFENGSGLVDPSSVNAIGKINSLNYIIYGTVDTAEMKRNVDIFGKFQNNRASVGITVYYMKADTGEITSTLQLSADQTDYTDGTDTNSLMDEAAKSVGAEVGGKLVGTDAVQGSVADVEATDFIVELGSNNGISENIVYAVYAPHNLTLPDGKVINDKTFICDARPISVDTDWCRMEPGKLSKDWLGKPHWNKSDDLISAIKNGYSVESTSQALSSGGSSIPIPGL